MVSTLSCCLLFGIIILTNGNHNYYNERSEGLIQKLSSLKAKHGLNFVHIEGIGSLLNKYKDSHPKVHYIEPDDPHYKQVNNPADVNTIDNVNLLVAMNKFKDAPSQVKNINQITRMESLRMCRKVPKELNKCRQEAEEEKKKNEEVRDSKDKKEKKRYYRAGYNEKHYAVAETAKLLDDLESLLAKNGKYNIFLGCVGDMCGGKSNKDRYSEDTDNTEVVREYLGCTGVRCGRTRVNDDDDEDNDVRRSR